MVKRIIATVAFVFVSVYMFAQYPTLTNRAKVVLFSCGPGPELYAGFGHSALWVSDDSLHIDRLYNYGTFDFDTPNFYGKFIRGKLDYMLSVTRASRFIAEYDQRKIAVDGQELMLSPAEKQRIFEFLENNLLPENRFYKYDFFYDNCATRIRDVLVKVVDGKVDFNTPDQQISFREMLFPYLTHTPWTKFGINLILGLTSDKKATPWDYMYLPDFLRDEFQQATIISNGTERKLVEEKKQYLPSGLDLSNRKMDDPVVVFSLILLVIILLTYIECKKKKEFRFVDSFLFGISVLAGLFLLFMWVGTDHIATAKNMNVLWLLPAQLLFLVTRRMDSLLGKKLNTIALIYQTLVAFILLLWPQDSEISFTFISLVFVVRIFGSMWRKK
ncbi:MAG: DUF4105 domain-containing protein [Bacteroidales bacterium]|nr:DUF4105 domain-containing protein [Bacteroidales bacterium]